MIISPPFLPAQPAGSAQPDPDADSKWVDLAMTQPSSRAPDSHALEGSFPLGAALMWHNGIHIQAPLVNNAYLPVRAIADGKVIYAKEGKKPNSDKDDPQNYYPWAKHDIGWSDNGIVIIEHDSEIGASNDEANTPTTVKFYSLCMHLSSLANNPKTKATWKVGDFIHRKDELGKPGQVYGHAGQIHFEICCDAANLKKIIGRAPGWSETDPPIAPTADGRSDSVFGATIVYLPADTPTHVKAPTTHRRLVCSATTLGSPQWVLIQYSRGTAVTRCFDISGKPIGAERRDKDFEYNLYDAATKRHKALGTDAHDSSPSGWYELLRFGRNLGSDKLPLDAEHWREISTSAGTVWADLNAPGTFKFSDADFLPMMGWNCFDDDVSTNDQRCDSMHIKRWICDPAMPVEERLKVRTLAKRLGEEIVVKKLRRAICKFPSEWERGTVTTRHQWLRDASISEAGLEDDARWQTFLTHCEAMSFADLPQAYLSANWRIHPTEFIDIFRRCGWLSTMELAQCFPRKLQHLMGTKFHTNEFSWEKALLGSQSWGLPFNRANRKYGIVIRQRLTHYFAQVIPETGYLALMKESDNRTGTYLKGKSYYPYYGRGLIQLTHYYNYKSYGEFRGFEITEINSAKFSKAGWNPDILLVESNTKFDAYNCADSAGYYINQRTSMLKKMDDGIGLSDSIAVSRCVNGNVAVERINGLEARLQGILILRDVLLDRTADAESEILEFDWRRSSSMELTGRLDKKGNPEKAYFKTAWKIDVQLTKQRP